MLQSASAAAIVLFIGLIGQPAAEDDKPAIGVQSCSVDQEIRNAWRSAKVPGLRAKGVFVISVLPNSPAAKAGIKPADVLTIDESEKPVTTPVALADWVESSAIGTSNRVTVRRLAPRHDGTIRWERLELSIAPEPRSKVAETALRYMYFQLDDAWIELPVFDFTSVLSTKDEPIGRFDVGDCGKLPPFRIVQIFGDEDMLVEVREEWLRLTGVSTRDQVDDRFITTDESIAIIGTWRYDTALGSTRTVFVAAPLSSVRRGLADEGLAKLREWLKSEGKPSRLSKAFQ